MEAIMQERYCECGHVIKVQFVSNSIGWRTVYWFIAGFSGNRVFVCPSCGRHLDIDALN